MAAHEEHVGRSERRASERRDRGLQVLGPVVALDQIGRGGRGQRAVPPHEGTADSATAPNNARPGTGQETR